jgi:hypothetical protein
MHGGERRGAWVRRIGMASFLQSQPGCAPMSVRSLGPRSGGYVAVAEPSWTLVLRMHLRRGAHAVLSPLRLLRRSDLTCLEGSRPTNRVRAARLLASSSGIPEWPWPPSIGPSSCPVLGRSARC